MVQVSNFSKEINLRKATNYLSKKIQADYSNMENMPLKTLYTRLCRHLYISATKEQTRKLQTRQFHCQWIKGDMNVFKAITLGISDRMFPCESYDFRREEKK